MDNIRPDNHAVMVLAKEIGQEKWEGISDDDFIPEFVRQLAIAFDACGLWIDQSAHRPHDHLKRIMEAKASDMVAVTTDIRDTILSIDNYDGWPDNRTNNAISCLALCFMVRTRWMAEASKHVWEVATGSTRYCKISKFSMNAWQRHIFNNTVEAINQ